LQIIVPIVPYISPFNNGEYLGGKRLRGDEDFVIRETGSDVVKRKAIVSWALYDFANTIFSANIFAISSLALFFGTGILILRKIPQR
jgi:hypothetical protein